MCLKCRWAAQSSGRNLCYLIVGDNECCAPDTSLDTPHWSESLMSLLMTNNNNNTASGQCRDPGHCQEEVIISVSVVSIWCVQVPPLLSPHCQCHHHWSTSRINDKWQTHQYKSIVSVVWRHDAIQRLKTRLWRQCAGAQNLQTQPVKMIS